MLRRKYSRDTSKAWLWNAYGTDKPSRYLYERIAAQTFRKSLACMNAFEDIYYLDFVIDLLKKELKYSALLEINRDNDKYRFVYPFSSMNAKLIGYQSEGKQLLDLSKDHVISAPWKLPRYKEMLQKLKIHRFEQRENQGVDYYAYLDIACVYRNMHSIGVANYLGEGFVEADYYDATKIFPFVNVEGIDIVYNQEAVLRRLREENIDLTLEMKKELNRRIEGVDYRLALLYELCQKKYFLEQAQNA